MQTLSFKNDPSIKEALIQRMDKHIEFKITKPVCSLPAISENQLFDNIESVWVILGRQPKFRDMDSSISKYSSKPYRRKFGTFMNALTAFVKYINSEDKTASESEITRKLPKSAPKEKNGINHKTQRNPSESLKVRVLMRDGNKCRLCGITVTGENIHFDHIIPWSRGGETSLDNIQVLCSKHNLAKRDYMPTNY